VEENLTQPERLMQEECRPKKSSPYRDLPKVTKKDSMVLSFSEEDAQGVLIPHDDELVVALMVANHVIH
jgi:hypothetical protein